MVSVFQKIIYISLIIINIIIIILHFITLIPIVDLEEEGKNESK